MSANKSSIVPKSKSKIISNVPIKTVEKPKTSFFDTITKGFTDVSNKIVEDVTYMNGKIQQHTIEAFDPGQAYGILWEQNENVENCRFCNETFSALSISRHHCRSCAGVFCEKCCPTVSTLDCNANFISTLVDDPSGELDYSSLRLCAGCRRGECPGLPIKENFRIKLEANSNTDSTKSKKNTIEKIGSKLTGSIGLLLYKIEEPPSKQLKLSYGSYYGEDGKPKKGNKGIPMSGYFEVVNKSKEVFAIKVLVTGGNVQFEVPRPSYIALPPNESCHCFFDPDGGNLQILTLHKNPNPIEDDKAINFNTTAPGAKPERLSKCAKVNFS